MHGLSLVVLLLSIAVLAVVVFRLLQLPPILGYLSAGVLMGPYALKLLPETSNVATLAELGIVFLMFTIGLEFSLPKLHAMRRTVFGLGGAQVATSMLLVFGLGWLVNFWLSSDWRMSGASWLALGGVLAMSSTAIVMKILAERGQLDSTHGRTIFGVLLFQDLAVVPLLILIPALARGNDIGGALGWTLGVGLLKAALVLVVMLRWGQKPMHGWLSIVARRHSQELFMLNLFLMTLGFALLTYSAGLSLALGAFLAGMLISETEFKLKVEEDIQPFKDILLGFFFITMGMQLDLAVIAHHPWMVLAVLVGFLFIKLFLILTLAMLFHLSAGNAIRVALALAPAGEFALVLLNLGLNNGLFNPTISQWVLAAILLSMFLTPFVLQHADAIAFRFSRNEWLNQSLNLTHIASSSMDARNHVVIAGFGRSGQALAQLLQGQALEHIGIDIDPEMVQRARLQDLHAVYGDLTSKETLMVAGAHRARAVVVTHINPHTALRIIHQMHELNPEVPVIVRSSDDTHIDEFQEAGAVAVVPEILEGSLVLAAQTLLSSGMEASHVDAFMAQQRHARYDPTRAAGIVDHQPAQATTDTPQNNRVTLTDDSLWTDQAVGTLPLEAWRVALLGLSRGDKDLAWDEELCLRVGDVLTFGGTAGDVEHAMRALNGEI